MSGIPATNPEQNNTAPVFVVGGLNMDILGTPHAPLLLRDSNPGTVTLRPGGVGRNIAWGIARLGLSVELVTAVGEDAFGAVLLHSCHEDNIGTAHVISAPGGSGTYLCVHDSDGDMHCAINQMDAIETLSPEALFDLLPELNRAPLVVLDANLPSKTLSYLAEHITAPLFVDPVSAHKAVRVLPILSRLRAIKPNRIEAQAMTGFDCSDHDGVRRAADFFLKRGVKRVYLSLGADGIYYADTTQSGFLPSLLGGNDQPRDTTGAGDAMTAALIYGEWNGLDAKTCAKIGLLAARERILTGELTNAALSSLMA